MTWTSIFGALLMLLAALSRWLSARAELDAGQAQAVAAHLTAALDEVVKANTARRDLRDTLEREPARLRDDDGFKRN